MRHDGGYVMVATRKHFALRLHFSGGSAPELVRTEFGSDESVHEWMPGRTRRPALDALAALVIQRLLGDEPLTDRLAVAQLLGAIHHLGKYEFKWPGFMLQDRALLRELAVLGRDRDGDAAWLSADLVPASQITVKLDGKNISRDSRALERLRAGLLERISESRGVRPARRETSELERAIAQSFGPAAARVSITVGEADGHVPRLAAARLMEIIRGRRHVAIGLSGGALQQAAIHELRRPMHRGGKVGAVRIVALNVMKWCDARVDCSAEFLAFGMASLFASAVDVADVALPPLPHMAGHVAQYRRAIDDCGVLMLSCGSPTSSFISEYLAAFGQTLPPHAVGDLAGHPIDGCGARASTAAIDALLAPLGCQPSLDRLRAIVRGGRARVMLIADGVPGNEKPPEAKGLVVRAALLGGLVNEVVIPRGLADIVAGERLLLRA